MGTAQPNIALVVLDTLRKDSFEAYFDWLPGIRHENAWSTSHGTVPAHGSLFTGLYPSEVGMTGDNRTLNCPDPVLPELLSAAGYRTRGFSCNTNITPFFDYDRGFDDLSGPAHIPGFDRNVLDWKQFVEEVNGDGPSRYAKAVYECITGDVETVPSLKYGVEIKLRDLGIEVGPDDNGGQDALEWLSGTSFEDSGEFLFVNLMEAHGPYAPPEEYRSSEPVGTDGVVTCVDGWDTDIKQVKQVYNDGVGYLSHVYEQFYAGLGDRFDVILTVADHGESFGEYGTYQHLIGISPELTHVPLVISGSADVEVHDPDQPASLIDVFQTVLSVAGVEQPANSRGRSLLEPVDADDEDNLARLTEYHGLADRPMENLARYGYDQARIGALNTPCFGVATAEGYLFDVPGDDATHTTGEISTDESRLVDQIRDSLREPTTEYDTELRSDVADHLEDLGYA